MWKDCQLVMLPTNEKSKLVLSYKEKSFNQLVEPRLTLIEESNYQLSNIESRHLYFLSDEEIKEGDWYYWSVTNTIQKAIKDSLGRLPKIEDGSKKIIATTDRSLMIGFSNKSLNSHYLPQIPQQFIEYFVSEYNKGNIISEVLVEYETIQTTKKEDYQYFGNHQSNLNYVIRLKINPNNTINIKPIKDSYSREEVIELIKIAVYKKQNAWKVGELDKWIEKNL